MQSDRYVFHYIDFIFFWGGNVMDLWYEKNKLYIARYTV